MQDDQGSSHSDSGYMPSYPAGDDGNSDSGHGHLLAYPASDHEHLPPYPDDDSSGADFSRRRRGRRNTDLRGAPSWVKAFVWVGGGLGLAGFVVLAASVLGAGVSPTSAPPERPPYATGLGLQTPPYPAQPTGLALDPQQYPPHPTGLGLQDPPYPAQPTGLVLEPQPYQPVPRAAPPGVPNLGLGGGLFITGFVLTAIGAIGHSTATRR